MSAENGSESGGRVEIVRRLPVGMDASHPIMQESMVAFRQQLVDFLVEHGVDFDIIGKIDDPDYTLHIKGGDPRSLFS